MKNVSMNPMVPFVFLCMGYNSKNCVLLNDVTIRRNDVERD